MGVFSAIPINSACYKVNSEENKQDHGEAFWQRILPIDIWSKIYLSGERKGVKGAIWKRPMEEHWQTQYSLSSPASHPLCTLECLNNIFLTDWLTVYRLL